MSQRPHTEGAEMARLIRELDWSKTPIGPRESWPQSLRTAVSILVDSRYPMFVFWGPHLVKIYNDSYRPVTGDKHPWALGRPGPEVWPEIWDTIGPMVDKVVKEGQATWSDDLLLFLGRHGFLEEVYFTFSYSPIRDESGGVGGLFCACTETTDKVLGERRMRTLRDLAAAPAQARSTGEVCRLSASVLEENPSDVPFSLLYLRDGSTDPAGARLVSSSGTRAEDPVCVSAIHAANDVWGFEAAARARGPVWIDDLAERFATVPPGPWPEPPSRAVVHPLLSRGSDELAGFVVLGMGSRRTRDERYADFLSLVAGQIGASIANARASEEERRRVEALAQLDRAKTAFFSNVSHEFRTPLTLMLGPTEDALASPDGALRGEDLRTVHRNEIRLLKLVNTLLDFSRIEAGRAKARYERTDLAALTTDLASAFRSAIERGGLTFEVDCPTLDEHVYVDRTMWEKIVLNLLSNALKFTFVGAIRVTLRREEDRVVLRVIDTGEGIAEEDLPHLFDRFHRIEGTRSRTHEGSGIGLALVRELVGLHGGDIHVESRHRLGSTFVVRLPVGAAHLPAECVVHESEPPRGAAQATPFVEEALRWLPDPARDDASETSGDGGPGGPFEATRGARVLVADDNADMREYLSRILRPWWSVQAVGDGMTALQRARTSPPDLILSDVMMPGLDGFGLLREIRADPRTQEVPFFILSARAGEEARVEGLSAGADDYLTKPFSARELVARIGSALALAAARRETAKALRASEERFRLMADHSPVMVWVTDPGGECAFVNRSWRDFTGLTLEDALHGGWLKTVHQDDQGATDTSFREASAQREPFRREYRIRRRDGEYRWALETATPFLGPDGGFRGFIGSVVDITEHKQAAEVLRQDARRKDEFLAMLGHELRNPLSPLQTSLELVRAQGPAPDVTRHLDVAQRQVSHLSQLVDDLLDVSRITQGKIELRRRRVDLRSVATAAVEATANLIESRAHELRIDLDEAPVDVDADPVRLEQVVVNLLTNAAKYTPEGGTIEVSVRGGGRPEIRVRDDGIGIPPELRPHLFDLFQQGARDAARAQGGLGIGLTIVHRLVTLHGGTIEVSSAGTGSEFVVRLPPARGDAPSVQDPEASPADEARARRPSSARVLVVDDNEDSASAIAEYLTICGYDARADFDGESCLDTVRSWRPDVVILDLGLPGLDGFEVAERLRAMDEPPVLFALTGYGQAEDHARTAEAGFRQHLVKPVDVAALNRLIGEVAPPSAREP